MMLTLLDKVSLIVGRILLIQAVHVANGDLILNMISVSMTKLMLEAIEQKDTVKNNN